MEEVRRRYSDTYYEKRPNPVGRPKGYKLPHKQVNRQKPESICWNCKRACGGDLNRCNWSFDFTPIEGWTAEKTIIEINGREEDSYIVLNCPQFERLHHFLTWKQVCEEVAQVTGKKARKVAERPWVPFKEYTRIQTLDASPDPDRQAQKPKNNPNDEPINYPLFPIPRWAQEHCDALLERYKGNVQFKRQPVL